MKLHLLPLLVLFHIQTVDSCIKFFDDCCSDYIPHQLPENTRFNDPDILYMAPKITTGTDCSKATVDCTFSGMPSDMYNLVFSDSSDKVTNVKESSTPIFDLDCNTGTENYISCELGCDSEKCPRTDCCSEYIPHQLPENTRFDDPDILYMAPKMTKNSDCSKVTVDCTFSGMPSEIYNLVFSDKDDKVTDVVNSDSPIFELDCNTEAETYISCELGCNSENCQDVVKDCRSCQSVLSIVPIKDMGAAMFGMMVKTNYEACYIFSVNCSHPDIGMCTYKMIGETKNSETITIEQVESTDGVAGSINCSDDGEFEFNGQALTSLQCTYEDCH